MTVDADAVLKAYGLDVALIADDDAGLWAAVLAKHWPAPDHPRLNVEGLRFYVGGELETPVGGAHAPGKWVFERVAPDRLRAKRVDRFPGRPRPLDPSDRTGYPYRGIGVSETTGGREEARVVDSRQSGPRAGYGRGKVWRRGADGAWSETDEAFNGWIS